MKINTLQDKQEAICLYVINVDKLVPKYTEEFNTFTTKSICESFISKLSRKFYAIGVDIESPEFISLLDSLKAYCTDYSTKLELHKALEAINDIMKREFYRYCDISLNQVKCAS